MHAYYWRQQIEFQISFIVLINRERERCGREGENKKISQQKPHTYRSKLNLKRNVEGGTENFAAQNFRTS